MVCECFVSLFEDISVDGSLIYVWYILLGDDPAGDGIIRSGEGDKGGNPNSGSNVNLGPPRFRRAILRDFSSKQVYDNEPKMICAKIVTNGNIRSHI